MFICERLLLCINIILLQTHELSNHLSTPYCLKYHFRYITTLVVILCIFLPLTAKCQDFGDSSHNSAAFITNIISNPPYIHDKKLTQDWFFYAQSDTSLNINVRYFYFKSNVDSVKIFSADIKEIEVLRGVNCLIISEKDPKAKLLVNGAWLSAAKSLKKIPTGEYKYFITISDKNKIPFLSEVIVSSEDSLLSANDFLGKKLCSILGKGSTKLSQAVVNKKNVIDHFLMKKGINTHYDRDSDFVNLSLYHGDWYLGCYKLDAAQTTSSLDSGLNIFSSKISSIKSNSLESYQSLLSQVREIQEDSKENTELNADISLSGNFSNGQEPNSELSNNYYEARVEVSLPIFEIPIQVSGFYTTQDQHRQAKASYVHFKYDADKAKEKLMKLIAGFDRQYQQSLSQGVSYKSMYGAFINQLEKEKSNALTNLKKKYGIDGDGLSGYGKDKLQNLFLTKVAEEEQKITDSLQKIVDSSGLAGDISDKKDKAMVVRAKAEEKYAKAQEQYQKLIELEQKIDKYRKLLSQYEKVNLYDSLLAYDKVKDLRGMENMSYKDMAKKASAFLPENKMKSAVTGLVNFDAGMFPKYVSDYTMSGQMLKGLDASYDIGFGTIGGSYGKMEYIDRNGNVEGYKAYSGRIQFKPLFKQQFGFVYYGYSPGKSLLEGDGFFKDVSLSMPSFRNPVSIISTTYNGLVGKYLNFSGEYAFSNKPMQSEEAKEQVDFLDQSAYNIKAEALIPETNIALDVGYEHAGNSFENNTLPTLLAGTDRIAVKSKGSFLRSFLTLGVEYNYLIQRSFYSKGNNSKWGFDIATHSKQYPSVAFSYKPFSTFRSYNDTLNIAQKPISGEVWTGKASYQIKRLDKVIRLAFIYNSNASTNDTIQYSSTTAQFNVVLTKKTSNLMLNFGHSDINTNLLETVYPIYNNSWFGNASISGMIKEDILLSGGIDLTKAGPGISKYGCFISSGYTFKKLPLKISGNFRYNNFRMEELSGRQQLISGGVELTWHIKEIIYTD